MPFEKTRLFGELSLEVAACETSHDLQQNRGVIFRLPRASGALDPEPAQILAHPRQWALVKKTGQIVGGIGQKFAAAEADEEIEELLADGAIVDRRSGGGEFDMRHAEFGTITLQRGHAL